MLRKDANFARNIGDYFDWLNCREADADVTEAFYISYLRYMFVASRVNIATRRFPSNFHGQALAYYYTLQRALY